LHTPSGDPNFCLNPPPSKTYTPPTALSPLHTHVPSDKATPSPYNSPYHISYTSSPPPATQGSHSFPFFPFGFFALTSACLFFHIPPYWYHGCSALPSATPPETFFQHPLVQTKCQSWVESMRQRTRTSRGVSQRAQGLQKLAGEGERLRGFVRCIVRGCSAGGR